jgi:hypothetical protein
MAKPRIAFVFSELPRTRAEARVSGSAYYFTDRPCKRGHLEPRSTHTCRCRQCNSESVVKSNSTPHGRVRQAESRSRFARTPKGRQWSRRNGSKRRAVQRNALPSWADIGKINEFIAGCPPGFDIDHILPLKGATVCGLHVLENLQFLSKSDNCSKHNKVDPLTLEANVCILPGYRTYTHS